MRHKLCSAAATNVKRLFQGDIATKVGFFPCRLYDYARRAINK